MATLQELRETVNAAEMHALKAMMVQNPEHIVNVHKALTYVINELLRQMGEMKSNAAVNMAHRSVQQADARIRNMDLNNHNNIFKEAASVVDKTACDLRKAITQLERIIR